MSPALMEPTTRRVSARGLGLMALLLLAGCATSGSGSASRFPGRESSSLRFVDTAKAGCGAGNAAACVAQYGKEIGSVGAVANVVTAALETPKVPALDRLTRESIEEALAECADFARSEVLVWHRADFVNGRPTATECKQLSTDPKYKGKTWAQQLGIEMHEEARKCAEAELKNLVPGRFSLEQRYRYDRATRQKKPVSAEHEKALVESGNSGELKGSLVPDVVIHTGDLIAVQDVFDFKFPCSNDEEPLGWDVYRKPDHPDHGKNQGEVYRDAFGVELPPARVIPRWGVIR